MFEQACAFVDCAEFTEKEKYKIDCRTRSHMYVNISLSALACEIFIKTLIIQNGGVYDREHRLEKLWGIYKGLAPNTAESVETSLKDWFNSENQNMFDEMIADASNAFVEWRYVFDYEKLSINPQFLRGYRMVLRGVCCQAIYGKSWTEYTNGQQENL